MKQNANQRDGDEVEIPLGIFALSASVTAYEDAIRALWESAKPSIVRRGEPAVREFIDRMVRLAQEWWPEALLDILGVEEMTPEQELMADQQMEENIAFMRGSLGPAIAARLREDFDSRSLIERLAALDHRVIAMYAGALWAAGSLMFATFDGLQARDMAALFMFIGPDDEATCRGPRGCHQYANGIFPLVQILAERIIPGQLQCLTNCRHFLLPVVRIPADDEREQFTAQVRGVMEREGVL